MILAAWYHTILAFFFAVLAVLLIIVILLQRGKGVGLAGAFGGTGGSTAFGAKTGDVLTWITIVGAVLVLTFAIVLNFVFRPSGPSLSAPPPSPPSSTGAPVAPQPAAPQPVTPQPVTPQPVTPQPVTPQPVTPQPAAPQPTAPADGGGARQIDDFTLQPDLALVIFGEDNA